MKKTKLDESIKVRFYASGYGTKTYVYKDREELMADVNGTAEEQGGEVQDNGDELVAIGPDGQEIARWEVLSVIKEARYDGIHLPHHQSRRNETDKPTVYYIGVDDSDEFRIRGQFVMPNLQLTSGPTNDDFRYAAVTKVPQKLKEFIARVLAKYGKSKYIFVFKEEYSYGMQTHKRHARPSVVDVWYPNGQYWRYGLSFLDGLQESDGWNEKHSEEWQKIYDWFNANGYDMEDNEDLLRIEGDMFQFKRGCVPPGLSLTCSFSEAKDFVDSQAGSLDESYSYRDPKVLKVSCKTNPDYVGEFYKDQVIEEMRDLGMSESADISWIGYVLDHLFIDSTSWTKEIQDAFINNAVFTMVVDIDSDIVTLEKK